jgi:hypothetical protein
VLAEQNQCAYIFVHSRKETAKAGKLSDWGLLSGGVDDADC